MDQFVSYLQKQELGDKTIYEYVKGMERFYSWYESTNGQKLNIELLQDKELIEYKSYLVHIKKLKPKTTNKYLAALRKWLEMLQRKGEWNKPIVLPDVKVQVKNTGPKWLKDSEVNAIKYGIEQTSNDFLRARDRAMIYFCLYAGLRIGEVMSLKIDDVIMTPGKQKVIVREGKGGHYGEVPLMSQYLKKSIKDWLVERANSSYAASEFLFISLRSPKVTIGVINKMVERIKKHGKVEFTTHQLRHTFGYNIQEYTKDLRKTQELLRHHDVNATSIYTKPSQESINEALSHLDKVF